MAVTLNSASVDPNGYVNDQTVEDGQEDGQTAAAANAASSVAAQTKQLVAQVASGEDVPNATVGNVGASAAAVGTQGGELHTSVPNLPYQQVAKADAPTGQQIVSTVADMNLSSVTAYRILQQAGQKSFDLDSTISIAANRAVTSAKLQQVKDLKAQIVGERKSATTQLAFSLVGAGAGIAMGVSGNLLRGAAATKNSALDVDKEVAGVNTSIGGKGNQATQNFADKYREAREESIAAKKSAADAQKNTNADPEPTFSDKGYTQFEAYKNRLHAKKPDEGWDLKDTDHEAAGRFFAERAGYNKESGAGVGRSTLLERVAHHKDGKSSIGAGIDGGAQGVQGAISAFGTVIDTLHGGKYDADQAKLAQKQDEVQVSLAQQVADQAKSNKDRDLKQISDNLDAIKEVAARYASVVDKLT